MHLRSQARSRRHASASKRRSKNRPATSPASISVITPGGRRKRETGAGVGPPPSSRTPSHLPPGNDTGPGERSRLPARHLAWGPLYNVPSAGIGLVSGGFLGRRGVVVVGNVPMTRSARRDGKYPAMFLLRRRRAPILLQDLPEADGNEESKTSKGKSFCLRRWARHGSAAP